MVLMSNDFSTDESVIRTRSHNVSCSSNGTSILPLKWKPCNVSAVRDFPPGCGPIVQPVNVGSNEANPSSSLINNNNNNNQSNNNGAKDRKMGLIVEFHKVLQKGDNQGMLKDEISGPVNAVVEVDDNGGSEIKESIQKMNFSQRKDFVVRDFPPYCGSNATEPTEEERIRINGKRSL